MDIIMYNYSPFLYCMASGKVTKILIDSSVWIILNPSSQHFTHMPTLIAQLVSDTHMFTTVRIHSTHCA